MSKSSPRERLSWAGFNRWVARVRRQTRDVLAGIERFTGGGHDAARRGCESPRFQEAEIEQLKAMASQYAMDVFGAHLWTSGLAAGAATMKTGPPPNGGRGPSASRARS